MDPSTLMILAIVAVAIIVLAVFLHLCLQCFGFQLWQPE